MVVVAVVAVVVVVVVAVVAKATEKLGAWEKSDISKQRFEKFQFPHQHFFDNCIFNGYILNQIKSKDRISKRIPKVILLMLRSDALSKVVSSDKSKFVPSLWMDVIVLNSMKGQGKFQLLRPLFSQTGHELLQN